MWVATHLWVALINLKRSYRGAVAQSVERPPKVLVWCNSTDVGLNHTAALGGRKILAAPSVAEISALFVN